MIIKPTRLVAPSSSGAVEEWGGGDTCRLSLAMRFSINSSLSDALSPSTRLDLSKAPLVFLIHQQWQAQDQAKRNKPLSRDQNDQLVSE